jgi:hypothetical protein
MTKTRTALLVGVLLLLSASTIYSLMPDRFIHALPDWAKVSGACILVLGIVFEIVCAGSDLKSHFTERGGGPGVAQSASEKEPNQTLQATPPSRRG